MDINSGNITADSIEPLINQTKVICVVHLAGYPAEMKKIQKLAKKYKLFLVEDCSQAHGAQIDNSCRIILHIRLGVFAMTNYFNWRRGGMITTNNKNLYKYIFLIEITGK